MSVGCMRQSWEEQSDEPIETSAEKGVLLVDDNPENLDTLALLLAKSGFDLQIALTGQSALRKARVEKPDVILLDIRMPQMDGFEVCRQFKKDAELSAIPILFLSAADSTEEKVQGFSLGAVDFISKPFSEEEVLVRINLQLRQVEQQKELTHRLQTYQSHFQSNLFNEQKALEYKRHPSNTLGLVTSAMDLISKNLKTPLTLIDLAKLLGTNQNKVSAAFREHLKTTAYDFLREQRLEYAAQLLRKTPLQVLEISEQVGYKHGSDFAAAFKKRYGVSPRQFRQSIQNKQRT
ncbi:MAG: response regulator [Magnetococcales bacterium]|nr:response regulator [Magnetococcales bacterium]